MRWPGLVMVLMMVGCGEEATEFETLPEQSPAAMADAEEGDAEPLPEPNAPEPCTAETLEPETRWTGISDTDGLFRIRLSSQEDVCEEVGWWGGWSLSVTFEEGRPVPGTYFLDSDEGIEVRASHAVGKTQATPTLSPPGRLQILEVFDDGSIEGVVCDVVIDRDGYDTNEERTLTLHGRFTAGPC